MHEPPHPISYRYRLYPTPAQEAALRETLDRCRELYNAGLQERREAYRLAGTTLSCYDQINELPAVKEARPEYRNIHSQVLQDVLRRLDKAYQAFFRRVKHGETPGFPRFLGRGRYASVTFPQYGNGASLAYTAGKWGTLTLSKLGSFKVRMHRPVGGPIKTVTIRRDGDQWYVCFSVVQAAVPLPVTEAETGIDLGLLHLATLADGSTIENPRHLRRSRTRLAIAQIRLSRCQKGSKRRNRAQRAVARQHRKVRNQRADFCHKAARALVNAYATIVFEDLAIRNMVHNPHLAFAINDVAWGQFVQYVSAKAAWALRHEVASSECEWLW